MHIVIKEIEQMKKSKIELDILKPLAELGKLSLTTQICYYNYNYADGDCQEGKCERNEFCRLRNEMLKGINTNTPTNK